MKVKVSGNLIHVYLRWSYNAPFSATQSQHMPQVPSSSFVGGGSIPANGVLESTPFRFQGGNLNERLPTRIVSQPQPSPSLTGLNDQSSHGELVKKHKIVSDLLKVGQLPKRSGLKTEMPLDNQDLERVQRYVWFQPALAI